LCFLKPEITKNVIKHLLHSAKNDKPPCCACKQILNENLLQSCLMREGMMLNAAHYRNACVQRATPALLAGLLLARTTNQPNPA